jgi:hypothetical protein
MRRLAKVHHKSVGSTEPLWHIQLAIVVVIILQLVLDSTLSIWPRYLIAAIEVVLLLALMILSQTNVTESFKRSIAIALVALVTICNVFSLILVAESLFGGDSINGTDLLVSAFSIFITSIIIFGIWYWEMDYRRVDKPLHFLFSQESVPESTGINKGWDPTFFDYLYLSVVNAMSFSPTEAMPLTHSAKAIMTIQSIISIVIFVLVTARAVTIIGS